MPSSINFSVVSFVSGFVDYGLCYVHYALLLRRPQTLGQHGSVLDVGHLLQHSMPKDKKCLG